MIFGLTALMSSTSILKRFLVPGRKLVRNTSDRRASSYSTSTPSGVLTSRPMLRLPRLACSKLGLGSPSTLYAPVSRSPRCGSPVTGCSTLMTSAPQSASTAPADGTNHHCATSTTRMPFRTCSMPDSRYHARSAAGQRRRMAENGRVVVARLTHACSTAPPQSPGSVLLHEPGDPGRDLRLFPPVRARRPLLARERDSRTEHRSGRPHHLHGDRALAGR